MVHFFLTIHQFLAKHKLLLYSSLLLLMGLLLYLASQIHLEEDINRFMPETKDSKNIHEVFKNVKVKDKIVLLFSAANQENSVDPSELTEVCDAFLDSLQASEIGQSHIKSVLSKIDAGFVDKAYDYLTENLPAFLDTADYVRLDSLLLPENLEDRLRQNYNHLISPLSMISKSYVFSDPLGLTAKPLSWFNDLQLSMPYDVYNDHLFSIDRQYLIAIVSPVFGSGEISNNEALVDALESQIGNFSQNRPDVYISYFGGIPIGVYNARQIKSDSLVSMLITLVLVSMLILFAFRRKSAVFLILLPVIFGGLFALAILASIQGTISTIAVGAGSVVLGVALSYSIHVFCHSLHAKSAEQIIRELAYPMTIGSFTTIGAFAGLTFADSEILHDFGLFSCFSLIGTTVFCLVFLPHFMVFKPQRRNFILKGIEKFNAYPFDKNKYLLVGIGLVAIVCLFLFNKVKFNSDMSELTYLPEEFKNTEDRLTNSFQDEYKTVYFVSVGDDLDKALDNYSLLNKQLNRLKTNGLIKEFSSAGQLLISSKEQERRIALWNSYWTPEKKAGLKRNLKKAALKTGFKEEAFDRFLALLDKNYTVNTYRANEKNDFLTDWIDTSHKLPMVIAQVRLPESNKDEIYRSFEGLNNLVILDKPYFAAKMADVIHADFNTILYIVSILVFMSILISYGRLEITLITFLPMALSWVLILGLMALFGIEFNIINIVISTFIFGIGDDFSIFITDGLLSEYKTGKKIVDAHKTAIFFSAFTVVVGLGALVFSKHPVLHSISVTAMIGMLAVILISFTVQPFIFRLFISSRTAKGKFPYTLPGLLITAIALGIFALGSFILVLLSYLLALVPLSEKKKKHFFHSQIYYFTRFLIGVMRNEKVVWSNPSGEDFSKPAIIIANHQSVIDILQILALHKKIIMLTKTWVVRSPLFGRVACYAGFIDVSDIDCRCGFDSPLELVRNDGLCRLFRRPPIESIRDYLNDGYSVALFPEGSRSPDCKIRRFHKGAFFFANCFQADIIPVLLHGQGQVISKGDITCLKNGILACKILKRISYPELCRMGDTYKEQCKTVSALFRREHAQFIAETDKGNPYYRYKLVKNYTYKGPVLEWYTRIKIHLEKDYLPFEALIPQEATITDLGCGYGFLDYMLAFRSDKRTITSIDYDEEKIDTANHNFSKNDRICFIYADVSKFEYEYSDVFILNDMLHYLPKPEQDNVLNQCVAKLNTNGKIIIRDGNREKTGKHKLTRLTEFFSTRILGFNKKEHELCFLSTEEITIFAWQNRLSLKTIANDEFSSNTIYILEKR
jgi:predicted exporter/1-acyl-sn-glycerol-3-phosphate acyltransferase/2-polyprenyl-3-methyl-5-hydroxy-6-metoxy-1,4-benzoquinol methylase